MFKKCVLLVNFYIYLLELCITLCGIFIGTKHFIIRNRRFERCRSISKFLFTMYSTSL